MILTRTMTISAILAAVLSVSLLLGMAQFATAQETFEGPPIDRAFEPELRPVPFRSLQQNEEFRAELKDRRESFRDRARTVRDEVKERASDRRAEIKVELDTAATPEERRSILETAWSERETMREAAMMERRSAMQDRAKEMRKKLREHRGEFNREAKTEVGNRIKAVLEGILGRIGRTLEKFTDILERMGSKLAELEANGVDTTEADVALLVAEQAVDEATDTLARARATFETALDSDNPREQLNSLKEAVSNAKESVKEAHRALREALKQLKELTRNPVDDSSDDDA